MRNAVKLVTEFIGGAAVTYSISGAVYDADGSTPVPDATVALGALSAVSAANGTYTISNVPAGASGSMTCTKSGYVWTAKTISAMSGNLTNQNYTNKEYAGILYRVYGASEVFPLVDIASGTTITAKVSAARNGSLVGWDLQNAAGPVAGTLAPYSDGVNDYGSLDTVSLGSIFNGAIGSAVICGKVSAAGDWSDGVDRVLFRYSVDVNNVLEIYKHATLGIRAFAALGGGAKIATFGIPTDQTAWFMVGISWTDSANGNAVKLFFNGAQGGSTLTTFGAWAGTPTTLSLGSSSDSSASSVWKGWMAYHAVKFGAIWTPTNFADMYTAIATAG